MDNFDKPLSDTATELAARADAGQKLGMQSLEFLMGLAAQLNQKLDLEGAADAMVNNDVVERLTGQAYDIEKRSRAITASILREFAKHQ